MFKIIITKVKARPVLAAFIIVLVAFAFCVFITSVLIYLNLTNLKELDNLTKTGLLGDTYNGIIGPIIAFLVAILTFLAFYVQYLANIQQRDQFNTSLNKQNQERSDQEKSWRIERFESKLFDLIKLHRENINELEYTKSNGKEFEKIISRKYFKVLTDEFIECYREVRGFNNSNNPLDYLLPKYKKDLEKLTSQINPKIDLVELATIDIAYSILYFGLSKEGKIILKYNFLPKYADPYFYRLVSHLQLKPKAENAFQMKVWREYMDLEFKNRMEIFDEVYDYRRHSKPLTSTLAKQLCPAQEFKKYYGGHQHRLGHYFRHIFQSYKFLNENKDLTMDEKYFYGKTFRAQLSTYEQTILFINSVSSLGMKWEYQKESNIDSTKSSSSNNRGLITTYNLIKNLPGTNLFGIEYRKYYPNVEFESEEIRINKK